jgi:hypothetical protein
MENIIGIHADIRYNLSWNLFKLCRMPEPDTKIFLLVNKRIFLSIL